VLAASKGGDDRDLDWYRNVIAHPDIELTMAGQRPPMRARQASPQEKAELWPRMAAYAGYGSYQRAPNAISRWSSASRAERPSRLALATAVRRGGSASTVSCGPAHRRGR
jgi:hypothetical protein